MKTSRTAKRIVSILIVLAGIALAGLIYFRSGKTNLVANVGKRTPAKQIQPDTAKTGQGITSYKHPFLAKADSFNLISQYDDAIAHYKLAAIQFEKDKNWEGYVWSTYYVGRLYLLVNGQNYQHALPFLQQSLKKGITKLNKTHPFVGNTYWGLGLYYFKHNEATKSLPMYRQALAIWSSRFGEKHATIANVYNAMGDVYYYRRFESVAAENYYVKALVIRETLLGKNNPDLIYTYYNLMGLNMLKGDYEKAHYFCLAAIRVVAYVGNNKAYWAELLQGQIANIYKEQKKYRKAITHLHKAIGMHVRFNESNEYLPYYFNSLGDVYERMSIYDSAIVFYRKSIELPNQEPFGAERNQTYYNLGMAYQQLDSTSASLYYLNKCLIIRQKANGQQHLLTAEAFQGIGKAYLKDKRPDRALIQFHAALMASVKKYRTSDVMAVPTFSQVDDYSVFDIVANKALALQQLVEIGPELDPLIQARSGKGRPHDVRLLETSLAYYCLADTLITRFNAGYARESAKLTFADSAGTIYENALSCASQLYERTKQDKYLNLAFGFIDRRKANLLLEALNEREVFQQAGVRDSNYAQYSTLQKELVFLGSKLEEENATEQVNETNLSMLHQRAYATEQKIKQLREMLRRDFAYYATTYPGQDTLTLADMVAYTGKANAMTLEYFWGDTMIYVLGISGNHQALHSILRTKQVDAYIDSLRSQLVNGYTLVTESDDFNRFCKSSFYLYRTLVEPVLTKLDRQVPNRVKPSTIIIIPDGPLHYLPFEALITGLPVMAKPDYRRLPYLVKTHTLSYSSSARLLLNNQGKTKPKRDLSVLAFSFSNDNKSSSLGDLHRLRDGKFTELPGTAKEVRAISSVADGHFYMGEEATETAFKAEMPKYDVLHLAVHGESDTDLHRSRLIFKQRKADKEDGSLYAYELYYLKTKASLAVLSACESGSGQLNPGEGVFSIARGFLYAGCPSVIMSLWKVNDNTTAALMGTFYQQLAKGARTHASLRAAQLGYLENADRRTAHPTNWAAFIATGNTQPIVDKSSEYSLYLIVALTVILTLLMAYLINTARRRLIAPVT